MFHVSLKHLGNTFWLRNTVWTADATRATLFNTAEEAQAGLDKAKKFMKAAQYKAAKIEPSNL